MIYSYPFHNADEQLKQNVWSKGQTIAGHDPDVRRRDACGRAIRFNDHGNTNSEFGWEIDHIFPTSLGGGDALDNLQPLYWATNRKKGDTYPWYCENAA